MPRTQASAIKRSTQQARNAMRELDAQTVAQLQLLYQRTAEQVRGQIYAAADAGDRIQQHRLQQLLQQIDQVLEQLAVERDSLLEERIGQAAAVGVRPFTAQGVLAAGGSQAVLESSAAQRIAEAAVQFVVNMKQADGLNLSERVWRLTQGAKEALHRAIASAVIRGTSAARAAAELAARGQQIPGDMQQLERGGQAGHVVKLADLLTSGDGGELWKAERVFRTELNRAHGEAFMAGAEKTPGFAGFRFLLSPQHPKTDICDLLAGQNLHGLGAGVYPTRELTPWPAHPNTLSFLAIVFEDEISDADRAGKETELEALQRLGAEVREGVLGKTKAQYFDRGLLTKGMVRAKLGTVQDRLEREVARAEGLSWDDAKLQANVAKHGIHFDEARALFDGPTITRRTFRLADGEPRWQTLGALDGRAVSVVYTLRDNDKRIISMRKANKKEAAHYARHSPAQD
jgi:uncharacterized DUF497 family protein